MKKNFLQNKTILITGGTGSFGQKFTEICLKKYKPKKSLFIVVMNLNKLKWRKNFLETEKLN